MSTATNFKPYSKITFARVSDGEGGWTYTAQSTGTVYLSVEIHDSGVEATCRMESDLTVKDIVQIDDAAYEVLKVLRQDGGNTKVLQLDRMDRPIEPVEGGNS
jgi:hypothetical protein